ncbi:MAG TPA: PilZ domain-containing protein [Syntrophales bacterium]|nr:PilZ domain-containing protein [Syntrophales bacterium]
MNISPGSNVELILEMDVLKEKIEVRRAIIHDVEGDRYILSQTTPPVRPSDIGKVARVTRLTRKGDQLHRWGFSGKLEEIIREYPLNASRTVLALCIRKSSPFENYNLRMHYRVRPGSEWSKRIEVDSMPVNLIDISIGGALFSHGKGKPFEHNRTVEVSYTGSDGTRHGIPAVVRRAWIPADARCSGLEFVAVRFTQLAKELERELAREIMELQRGSLYKV